MNLAEMQQTGHSGIFNPDAYTGINSLMQGQNNYLKSLNSHAMQRQAAQIQMKLARRRETLDMRKGGLPSLIPSSPMHDFADKQGMQFGAPGFRDMGSSNTFDDFSSYTQSAANNFTMPY